MARGDEQREERRRAHRERDLGGGRGCSSSLQLRLGGERQLRPRPAVSEPRRSPAPARRVLARRGVSGGATAHGPRAYVWLRSEIARDVRNVGGVPFVGVFGRRRAEPRKVIEDRCGAATKGAELRDRAEGPHEPGEPPKPLNFFDLARECDAERLRRNADTRSNAEKTSTDPRDARSRVRRDDGIPMGRARCLYGTHAAQSRAKYVIKGLFGANRPLCTEFWTRATAFDGGTLLALIAATYPERVGRRTAGIHAIEAVRGPKRRL